MHESSLEKVEPGLPARVSIEALLDNVIAGRVASISPMPDAQSRWLNPDLKIYDTVIHLDGELGATRAGMTCRAEIRVAEYADVLHVPVHAVVRVAGQPTVWVVEEGQLVPPAVVLGLDDNRRVHIVEGLCEGQLLALAPPLQAGDEERSETPLIDDEPEEEPPHAGPDAEAGGAEREAAASAAHGAERDMP